METVRLLPAVVKRAKDAARAVRSKEIQAIQGVKGESLTRILNLPHFAVWGYAIEENAEKNILHLHCRLTVAAAICPCCQAATMTIKEHKDRCVRDLDWSDMRTFIHFKIRRFECEQCDYRFTEELQAVGWCRRQTQRFEKAVYERCLESDKKAVAEAFHLSQSTVYGIFKNHAERIEQAQSTDGIVRILGMDEIAIKKRHKQFALVISDLERRCVIAVLPSRELAGIVNWFLTETVK